MSDAYGRIFIFKSYGISWNCIHTQSIQTSQDAIVHNQPATQKQCTWFVNIKDLSLH